MRRTIIRLDETDSTNRFLHNYRAAEDDELLVAVTSYQTAGKGQGSNSWESERGKNLLFSMKMKPVGVTVTKQFLLSKTMAVAIKEALSYYAGGFSLKWPNDIYWHDYKISGTLIETSLKGNRIESCIFGIGIDVNQRTFLSDAPNPISLCSIINREEDIDSLLVRILDAFEKYYAILVGGGHTEISALYHDSLYRHAGLFRYRDANGEFRAEIDRVEDDGHLVLKDEYGAVRSYAFKEVEFIISRCSN